MPLSNYAHHLLENSLALNSRRLKMIWCKSECGKYRIESLTAATVPGALHVIEEALCKNEPVCIGTEVNINSKAIAEIMEISADAALDGVSIVAVEISSEKVVAALFNKLLVLSKNSPKKSFFDMFADERCTQPSTKALLKFMAELHILCNFFEKYAVDCSLEMMFLGTLKEHRRRKLAFLLMKTSLVLGSKLKDGPVSKITIEDLGPNCSHIKPRNVTTKVPLICHALCTSIGTQKIAKDLGFTTHLRVSLREFVYNGKTYVDRLGYDPGCEAIALPIDSNNLQEYDIGDGIRFNNSSSEWMPAKRGDYGG